MAKQPQSFKIEICRTGRNSMFAQGTLEELIKYFSYTLECGKSYEHEKGNKKINLNPKNIKSLISNVQNAKDNSAANGYSGFHYKLAQ